MAADGTITLNTKVDKTGAVKDLNSLISELNDTISKGLIVNLDISSAKSVASSVKELRKEKEASSKITKEESQAIKEYTRLFDEAIKKENERIRKEKEYAKLFDSAALNEIKKRNSILSSQEKQSSATQENVSLEKEYARLFDEIAKKEEEQAVQAAKLRHEQSESNKKYIDEEKKAEKDSREDYIKSLKEKSESAKKAREEEQKYKPSEKDVVLRTDKGYVESFAPTVTDIEERKKALAEYTKMFEELGVKAKQPKPSAESASAYKAVFGGGDGAAKESAVSSYNELEKDITTIQSRIDKAVTDGNTEQAESYRKLLSDIGEYYKKLEDISSLEERRVKAAETGDDDSYQKITAQIAQASAAAERFAANIRSTSVNAERLQLDIKGISSIEAFKDDAENAKKAAQATSDYGREMANAASTSSTASNAIGQFQQLYEQALKSGKTTQAEIIADIQKTISGIERQNVLIEQYKQKLAELYAEQKKIGGAGVDITLDTRISSYEQKLSLAQASTNKLSSRLQKLADSARYSGVNLKGLDATLKNYNATSKNAGVQATGLRGKLLGLYKSITKGSAEASKASKGLAGSLNKINERFAGLTSRVFVFSVWTMAMRSLRGMIGKVVNSNEEFKKSLESLQASLWTAFSPIINFVIPILTKLVQWLTTAITAITKFVASISGISYKSMVKSGEALSNQANGYEEVSKKADKAKKAQDRYLASFDKINKAQDTDKTTDTSDIEEPKQSAFSTLGKSQLEDSVKSTITKIVAIVGGALLALGIILCLVGAFPVGIKLIILGALALYGAAAVAWDSGDKQLQKTLETIMKIVGGFLIVVGLFLVLTGAHIALGIALIIAGALTEYAAAQIDSEKVPKTVKEILSDIAAIASLSLLAIGVILLCVGNIPLGIALLVAGITMAGATLLFGEMSDKVKKVFNTILDIIAPLSLIIGIILVCTGNLIVGIPLIVAGIGLLSVKIIKQKGSILGAVKSVFASIKNFWKKNVAFFFTSKYWKKLGDQIGKGFGSAMKAILNFIIDLVNLMIAFTNARLIVLRQLAVKVANALGKSVTLDDIAIPKIPHLAKGGIIPTQTLAMIGENGREAVIPLERNLGWLDTLSDMIAGKIGAMAGASDINLTINLDGNVIYKDVVRRNRESTRKTGKNALM